MKLKILGLIGLMLGCVTKTTDYPPLYMFRDLEGKQIITEGNFGKYIANFFKNNAVSWENSILANYIKTTKQVGNNIIRLAKKNVEILNYWDVKKELDYYKEGISNVQNTVDEIKSNAQGIAEEAKKIQNGLSNAQEGLSDIQKQLQPKFVKNLWEYVKNNPKDTALITGGIIGGGLLLRFVMNHFFSLCRARNELERIKKDEKKQSACAKACSYVKTTAHGPADESGIIEVVVII